MSLHVCLFVAYANHKNDKGIGQWHILSVVTGSLHDQSKHLTSPFEGEISSIDAHQQCVMHELFFSQYRSRETQFLTVHSFSLPVTSERLLS